MGHNWLSAWISWRANAALPQFVMWIYFWELHKSPPMLRETLRWVLSPSLHCLLLLHLELTAFWTLHLWKRDLILSLPIYAYGRRADWVLEDHPVLAWICVFSPNSDDVTLIPKEKNIQWQALSEIARAKGGLQTWTHQPHEGNQRHSVLLPLSDVVGCGLILFSLWGPTT